MSVLYKHSCLTHNTRAAEAIVPLLIDLFRPCESVVDIGCGTGTWLKVFEERYAINDFLGVDGVCVAEDSLLIQREKFKLFDLSSPLYLDRKFDILLCLEVAEHLPGSLSDQLVESLCRHSDLIAFSAAIPCQGGQNHLNEQWPRYWELKFNKHGYTKLDVVRPRIWNNTEVDVWYKQNMFIYTNNEGFVERYSGDTVSAEIHPGLWQMKMEESRRMREELNNFDGGGTGVRRSFKALINSIRKKL